MKRLLPIAALLIGACLTPSEGVNDISLSFDLNQVTDGWDHGAADFPTARQAELNVIGELRALPDPFEPAVRGQYLAGTNVSGNLFMYTKRYFSGLRPNLTYRVTIQVQFISNYHPTCTTGPGRTTFLKAGVSPVDLISTENASGIQTMNINKGSATTEGDFVVLSDITNDNLNCPATGTFNALLTGARIQPTNITTDENGGFTLWLGTQTTYLGRHEIYFTAMLVTLRPV
ncbi:MAG: hypothetical protein HOP28_16505 [Gemmatimonadales bacterium]|nr:hypothetical protein [Gemmatimonadales bacterium]